MKNFIKIFPFFLLILSFSANAQLCQQSCQGAQNARFMSCFKNYQLCLKNPDNQDWCADSFDSCKLAAAKASESCEEKCDENSSVAKKCQDGCFHLRDELGRFNSPFCHEVFICKKYDESCSVIQEEEIKTIKNCKDIKPSL